MSLVEANGIRFNVHTIGHGSPVVMLHGAFVGSLASWYLTVVPFLVMKNCILLYDLRGHGKSDKPTNGYDILTMTADLDAITGAVDFETPFSLVGHSYGALIAIRYAIDHPDKVKRLSVIDAPLPPGEMHTIEEFINRTPEELVSSLPAPVRLMVRLGGRRVKKFIESMRFLAFETNLTQEIMEAAKISDEELGKIACPVLCIYGGESPCRPAGERLRSAIPSSRLEILKGGHFVHIDATREVANKLTEFIHG